MGCDAEETPLFISEFLFDIHPHAAIPPRDSGHSYLAAATGSMDGNGEPVPTCRSDIRREPCRHGRLEQEFSVEMRNVQWKAEASRWAKYNKDGE